MPAPSVSGQTEGAAGVASRDGDRCVSPRRGVLRDVDQSVSSRHVGLRDGDHGVSPCHGASRDGDQNVSPRAGASRAGDQGVSPRPSASRDGEQGVSPRPSALRDSDQRVSSRRAGSRDGDQGRQAVPSQSSALKRKRRKRTASQLSLRDAGSSTQAGVSPRRKQPRDGDRNRETVVPTVFPNRRQADRRRCRSPRRWTLHQSSDEDRSRVDSGSDGTCQNEVRSGTGRSRHVGNWFTGQSAGISACPVHVHSEQTHSGLDGSGTVGVGPGRFVPASSGAIGAGRSISARPSELISDWSAMAGTVVPATSGDMEGPRLHRRRLQTVTLTVHHHHTAAADDGAGVAGPRALPLWREM